MSEKVLKILASVTLFVICFLLLLNSNSSEQKSEPIIDVSDSKEDNHKNIELIRNKASELSGIEADLMQLKKRNPSVSKQIHNKIISLGYPISNSAPPNLSDSKQLHDAYISALKSGIRSENERAITKQIATQNTDIVAEISRIKGDIESIHTKTQTEYLLKFKNYFDLIKKDEQTGDAQQYESRLPIDRALYIKVTGSPPKSENVDFSSYKAQKIKEINQKAELVVNRYWNTRYSSGFSKTPPPPPARQEGQDISGAQANYEQYIKKPWEDNKANYEQEANEVRNRYKQNQIALLLAELDKKKKAAISKELKGLTEAEWNSFLREINSIKLQTWSISLLKNGERRKIILKLNHSS